MPCNSDYLRASHWEVELSRVMCLLDELDGLPFSASHWDGYHPKVYNKSKTVNADALVSKLCKRLQKVDVTKQSLEMQIWWRDHQAADKARLEQELADKKTASDRKTALSKLTKYERKILGV